jgi:uncharacterized protein (DUF2141 family)
MKEKIFLIIMVVLCASCARIVTPTGGQRDVLPPKYLSSKPKTNQTNFKGKEIEVNFDEYIVLDNVNEKLIVSPPLKTKPEVSAHLKKLLIKGLDSLQDNTTYVFDFSDAITDYNEGNHLNHFSFGFSTGNTIDTLVYKGRLLNSYTLKPEANKYVALYSNLDKGYQMKSLPNYITSSDSNGLFLFQNIKQGSYQLIAFEDKDQNQYYNLPNEGVGFSSSLIEPISYKKEANKITTLKQFIDTFYYSEAKDTIFNIISSKLISNKQMQIITSLPISDSFMVNFSTPKISADDVVISMNKTKDTINYYAINDVVFDTVKANVIEKNSFHDKIELYSNRRRSKNKEEGQHFKMIIDQNNLPYYNYLTLSLPFPIDTIKNLPLKARLINKNDTTLISFVAFQKKMNELFYPELLKQNEDYTLLIDSNKIVDYRGIMNDTLNFKFKVDNEDDYGKFIFSLNDSMNMNVNVILTLYDNQGNKVCEDKITKANKEKIVFDNLKEGTFRLRAITDKNNNNIWDKNDFKKNIQAEKVQYFPKMISIRKGWELEEEWKISL